MTRIKSVTVKRECPVLPKIVTQYVMENGKWKVAKFRRAQMIFSAPINGTRYRDCRIEYRRVA